MSIERKKTEFRNTLIFNLWVFPSRLLQSSYNKISRSKLVFLKKKEINTNCTHFFSVSEPKEVRQLPFQPLVLQNASKEGWVEISVSFDLRVLGRWCHMKTFCLVLCLSLSSFFSLKLILIVNHWCSAWSKLFFQLMPFECSSNFFLIFSNFS